MWTPVVALGFTQTLAWASSTYLIAILARPIAADLDCSEATVFAAFSVALLVMGLAGPSVGRYIDRQEGRGALALSNVVLAAGLALLGTASSMPVLFAAWVVLGIGMAMGLYDAAFAALVRVYETRSRGPITGVTLIAGFASTVGWPLTAFVADQHGWRAACFGWAALHVGLALPINLLFIPRRRRSGETERVAAPVRRDERRTAADALAQRDAARSFVLVAAFASMAAFVTSAMAAHLPGLLLATGASSVSALAAAALVGPAQVAARLIEFVAAQRLRFHPLITARIAVALHPLGAVLLLALGAPAFAASAFALLHGAGNGMTTIARGTLPLALFGAEGYGQRQGVIGVSARTMQALAPYAFGVVLERYGAIAALATTIGCSLTALGMLLAIRSR